MTFMIVASPCAVVLATMATADLTRTPWRPALAMADSRGGMVAVAVLIEGSPVSTSIQSAHVYM
jgi:hypothetical protein